ncbi:MAG TPA: lysophospholipid acyltransferase family protein [Candidatus Limnocylindrales bacterium]|nr:lysophospholipid acyltransferase family protein [Candidatus Limnocylindrales bacterium]
MTQGRRLEAPHRRLENTPPRIVEKAAVIGYRAAMAVFAHTPPALSRAVVGTASQASYLAWPAKRRWSNINFGHVLGLPPDHPRVRRKALRAYKEYATYIVELMRLPSRSQEELAAGIEGDGIERLAAAWRESGQAMILVAGHLGNNEAVAAAISSHGYPANVIADDSTFPELFEFLRRQREAWGPRIIPWRNLRELFKVLRNREILALLVDWGYRPDGIPVRLFGAWTTLPAGPATLAAKTGAIIAPLAIRRQPGGRFRVEAYEVFTVPSSDPADIQQATQRIADFLEDAVAAAPHQWYSFKPIWPETADEAALLEARAAEMLASRRAAPEEAAVS